ncbi:MAG: phage tail tape measure protein [Pseudomonadota bacterium]
MSDSVVTELVISADTSGADQFSQSMDQAKSSADSGMSSAQGMALAIAGVGVAFVASLAALRGFVDYVGTANKQLIDIAENATTANMSTKEFQQTLFAARSSGVSEKDFISGLDKIGADLTAASRGVTDFGKLFDSNGLSIRDANGQLKDTKSALNDIAGLMQNATPQVQQGIAKIVGLSKEWVPFLREGEEGIEAQKQAAERLGIIIDDDVIAKAKDFNREWNTAIASWDLQFKASLTEILPLLVRLAQIAITIVDGVGSISGFFSRGLTSNEDMSAADLSKRIDDVSALADKMAALGPRLTEFQAFRLGNKKGSIGLDEGASLAEVDAYQDRLQDMHDDKTAPIERRARVLINGGTKLPNTGSESDDAYDRAIQQIERHTARTLADVDAVGRGAGAQAELRAETLLFTAAAQAGLPVTQAMRDRIQDLAQDAGDAAVQLAKAKVASDNAFGRNTAFLSQGDVQIASQLKGIYPDVAEALNSAEAAQIRLNNAARGLSSSIEGELVSGLTDITTGAKSASQGFTDMSNAIIKAIEQMIIKITIVEPLMRGLQGALGGFGIGGGGALPLPGMSSFIGPVASANGNVFGGGNVIPFAQGGVVDGPHVAPMALFGEAGPEAIVPLRRGADGNLGIASSGGGGRAPTVVINNHTDAQPQVSQSPNGDMTITLKKIVDSAVGDSLSTGTGRRVLKKQYGVNQFTGQ